MGTLLLPCPAWAQNTLAAMISTQYRVAPVIPFVAFDPESPNAPLPGSTIADISQRMLDGISATDLSTATICKPSHTAIGQLQGTQGFRQSFPAEHPENKAELRLLFGFDSDALSAIQTYETTISSANFLTIPTDRLAAIKAQSRVLGKCAQGSPETRTAIKPIVANVAVVFKLARPFSDETVRRLQQRFPDHPYGVEGLAYRLSMHRRLIALGMAD
ncbi:MAG TPA: hypothetical protein VGO49_05935 [Bradyrhizobium sp.]|nr:hypothetical protein [Bradyrhizobium sp.]